MRLPTIVSVVLVLAGCGNDSERACGQPTGTYRFHYEEQSGNCGLIADSLGAVDGPGSVPDGQPDPVTGEICNRDIEISSDLCTSSGVVVCRRTDGTVIHSQSVLDRYEGGALVMGTIQFSLTRDSALLCSSLYELTARRQ